MGCISGSESAYATITFMALSLKGKRVLITGSTDGLGRLLAQDLIQQGGQVIIHGKDSQKVESVTQELGATQGIVCDFNQPDTVQQSFSNINELDVLINNAGVWLEGPTFYADAKYEGKYQANGFN